VLCCVKQRQPSDVSSDGLNCILNFCDCSVTMVGGERLPSSSSINSVLASPVFSHLLLISVVCSLLLPSSPLWARARKIAVLHTILATNASASRLLPRRTSAIRYSEEEFSSESEGSPAPVSPSASSDDSDDSQGIAAEVWTYTRAVERAGLEGSDESEYSSDSSEEGSGGCGGDDGDDGGDGDGGGDSGRGGDGGSKGGNGGGSKGNNKASG
jgi:hypothetical protein